eukprot:GILJ01002408.1.p1 GENE.GILJ01002408.1~~GILJ01002408.1.p1  ORF type:complete len:443 (-),score=66.46 GILJ01002408.1:154-1440(-)
MERKLQKQTSVGSDKSREVKETKTLVKKKNEEGHAQINEYTLVKDLGEGAFGKVKLCVHKDTQVQYAVKIFKKSVLRRKREFKQTEHGMRIVDAMQDVMREIAIMKKLSHANIVGLHEVIDDDESDKLYMILDFVEGGQVMDWDSDILRYLSKLPEATAEQTLPEHTARTLFRDVVRGLEYLHRNGIVHRDLKPENLLVTADGAVKIADFGVAAVCEEKEMLKKTEGTYHFVAPECCVGQEFSGRLADIWSLGVTLYVFVCGVLPFFAENLPALFDMIATQPVSIPEHCSPELRHLLTKLLEKDPNNRYTLELIKNDEWVNGGGLPPMSQETTAEVVNVSEDDIKLAFTPLHTILFVKSIARKWQARSKSNLFGDAAPRTPVVAGGDAASPSRTMKSERAASLPASETSPTSKVASSPYAAPVRPPKK